MRHAITPDTHLRLGKGPFRIRRIRPGLGIVDDDTGFGGLGLVDRAHLSAGLVVPMHEHRDDEIVSYLRSGTLTHTDSDGNSENVSATRLMVMNAGSGFSHEERMPEGEDVHMLQIFLRPREAGLPPAVQFAELDEAAREGRWRLLVNPESPVTTDVGNGKGTTGNGHPAPATVRQDVLLHDVRLPSGTAITLPRRDGWDQWLYVFDGTIELEGGTRLGTGAAIAATDEDRIARVKAVEDSDLVLFELAHGAAFTLEGSLSRGR